ncbi:MAG: hypothetical protein KF866_03255 [Phycisphaeraceae bacterium]|nr:hypothetical protein [Phycisphaeraceae bacterium]MCW5753285.1 hypothetical protein [Phycisphaeraceae bacterium]
MAVETWENPDSTWTIASFVVRSLCTSAEVTPAEVYFVLTSLGIERRFTDYWDNHHFFQRAGLPEHASASIDPKRDGRIALMGDHAWASGDIDEAKRRYEHSIGSGDSSAMVGIGGLVRLHFTLGEYHKCIEAFRRGCPPHTFYLQYRELFKDSASNGMEPFNRLSAQYRGTSPYFLSNAKYMSRAIIAAAVRADGIDDGLRTMIADYFELEPSSVDELAKAVSGDEEIDRLRKKLAPKPIVRGRSLDSLRAEGDTERARRWCDCLPKTAAIVEATAILLDDFLDSGDPGCLDEMIVAGSPFGIVEVDGWILSEALDSRSARIATMPSHRLALMRRFNSICRYPKYDFLTDYLEVMQLIRSEIEPGDAIAAILDLQWYKTSYSIDNTGPGGVRGGFGKTEISDHREWLEIALRDHPPVFDRDSLASREKAISALHGAYLFLRERFNEMRRDERWISEAQLGDALSMLFGKAEVQRHARPLWLNPQHLDYFIPRYALAIEYMGAQHYQPVSVFGGERALEETKARDERKRAICERMGINLVYVTHEEDVGRRAREIHAIVSGQSREK